MKKFKILILPIIMVGCIMDPVGVHKYIVINNSIDTFEIRCFIDKKDSTYIITPKDSIEIFEGINNSGTYTRNSEENILQTFDSILLINKKLNQILNISDYRFWVLKVDKDSMINIAKSFYSIN